MIGNYQEALDFLYESLPMFQRIGNAAFKKDLNNTIELCRRLGNPHTNFRSIHVAGTNGKGSVSHMLAAIYQAAGYKTGLYTSPHLKDFTERIRVNGKAVDRSFVIDFVNENHENLSEIKPSFFETTVAMAFQYFSFHKVDIALIEVGMGGRLDSTNIINPDLSIITNIGWDHMQFLGNTLPAIAAEKAGIIKPGGKTLISEFQDETFPVFHEKCQRESNNMYLAGDLVEWKMAEHKWSFVSPRHSGSFQPDLKGSYQERNIPCVLAAVSLLQDDFPVDDEFIGRGIENTTQLTGLKGRWQQLPGQPLIFCDTGHNEPAVRLILEQIRSYNFRRLHMVWGMVKDKDISKILALLPRDAEYYFCSPQLPRALPVDQLLQSGKEMGLRGKAYLAVSEAIAAAKKKAATKDLIFIGGSNFVVAEIDDL